MAREASRAFCRRTRCASVRQRRPHRWRERRGSCWQREHSGGPAGVGETEGEIMGRSLCVTLTPSQIGILGECGTIFFW